MKSYNLEISPLPFLSVQIVHKLLKEMGITSYTINYLCIHNVLEVRSSNILTNELERILEGLRKEGFQCKNIYKSENKNGK